MYLYTNILLCRIRYDTTIVPCPQGRKEKRLRDISFSKLLAGTIVPRVDLFAPTVTIPFFPSLYSYAHYIYIHRFVTPGSVAFYFYHRYFRVFILFHFIFAFLFAPSTKWVYLRLLARRRRHRRRHNAIIANAFERFNLSSSLSKTRGTHHTHTLGT